MRRMDAKARREGGRRTKGLAAGLLLAAFAALAGCAVERRYSVVPERNQVLHAESGDRFLFDLEENMTTGYSWRATCDDADVDVSIKHVAGATDEGMVGVPGTAEVEIRVHRGYDGPSKIRFLYRRDWESAPIKEFTITLYNRTGDRAFWE